MVYIVSCHSNFWHAAEQRFPSEVAAIRYLERLMGCEGRIEGTSKDRVQVYFDGRSRFSGLAG
jgi:hypothetical protein